MIAAPTDLGPIVSNPWARIILTSDINEGHFRIENLHFYESN